MIFSNKKLILCGLFATCGLALLTNCNASHQLTIYGRWGYFNNDMQQEFITINIRNGTTIKELIEQHPVTSFFDEVHQFAYYSSDIEGEHPLDDNYAINSETSIYAQYEEHLSPNTTYILANISADEDPSIIEDEKKPNVIKIGATISLEYVDDIKIEISADPQYYTLDKGFIAGSNICTMRCAFDNYHHPCVIKIEGPLEAPINNYHFSYGHTDERKVSFDYLYGGANSFISHIAFSNSVTKINCSGTRPGATSGFGMSGLTNLCELACCEHADIYGGSIFKNCVSLRRIPHCRNSTANIVASNAFYNCKSLKHVYLEGSGIKSFDTSSFELSGVEEVVCPPELLGISPKAFAMCKQLKRIVLNKKISYLSQYAFSGCNSLESIDIPRSTKLIDSCTFDGCTNLSNINFEEGSQKLQLLGEFVYGCNNLTYIHLPRQVNSLPSSTFSYCGLEVLDIRSITSVITYDSPFGENTPLGQKHGKIIVPSDLLNAYKTAPGWQNYQDIIVSQ